MQIKENVLVTMTSWYKRISNVKTVLETLECQTIKPTKIILNLCTEDFPNMEEDLPLDLLEYISLNSNIEIYWFIENYKAWKKHLHTLDIAGDDDIIISVDDDHLYPVDFIEKMYVSFCYYKKEFPVTFYISNLFHNLWTFYGAGTLYKKSFWGADYKKYLTQQVLHNAYEDIIITIIFATNHKMVLPQMFDLPEDDSIIFDDSSPFSDIDSKNISDTSTEKVSNMMASTLVALEDAFDRFYFYKDYKHKITPHFWQIFVEMVESNRKYYNKYAQVKYVIDAFYENYLSGTLYNVDYNKADINKKRYTKEELIGKGNSLIVTIASWTKRIHNVEAVLRTIVENTIIPDKIVLNLAKDDFILVGRTLDYYSKDYIFALAEEQKFSKSLAEFITNYNIEIHWYDDAQIKSWKKHLYVINNFKQNDVIICIDDDVLYTPVFIETMLKSYNYYGRKYPIGSFTNCFCQGSFAFCGYSTLYTPYFFRDFNKYISPEILHKFPEDNHLLNILNVNNNTIMPVIGADYLYLDSNFNEGESNFGNLNFSQEWWDSYSDIIAESARIIENSCRDREEVRAGWRPIYFNFAVVNLKRFLENEKSRENEYPFSEVYYAIKTHIENSPGSSKELTNLPSKIDHVIL